MRNRIFVPFLIAIAGTLYSCSPATDDDSSVSVRAVKPFRVILITDVGGRGDKGFNDAGWAGCEEAKSLLAEKGVTIENKCIESREQTDYVDNLNLAAERADVIVALGFLIAESVAQIAPHYPEKSFIFIDGRIEGNNIASFDFKAQEGGFLAGLLAVYVSNSGVVGVMPGMDIPPVEAFAAGYRAGAMTGGLLQGKPIEVLSTTIGSFSDPVKAKSIAQSLMSRKADVLFQLAGNSGLGVIEAVRDSPELRYAIGVDINQDDLAPGRVLTSVLKRMDKVVCDRIVAAYEGKFQSGVFAVGLKEGYVGLTEMVHTRKFVPPKAWSVIEKARKLIASGELIVPKTYAELNDFHPPIDRLRTP